MIWIINYEKYLQWCVRLKFSVSSTGQASDQALDHASEVISVEVGDNSLTADPTPNEMDLSGNSIVFTLSFYRFRYVKRGTKWNPTWSVRQQIKKIKPTGGNAENGVAQQQDRENQSNPKLISANGWIFFAFFVHICLKNLKSNKLWKRCILFPFFLQSVFEAINSLFLYPIINQYLRKILDTLFLFRIF